MEKEFQKWIGYTDVKSAPVYFYAQRNSSFNCTTGTPFLFDLARVNEGNAVDLTTGKFTAPRSGIYFFSFTGLAKFPDSSIQVQVFNVDFLLNGALIAIGSVTEANTVAGQISPLTFQSTLNLKKGDQLWVAIGGISAGVVLFDDIFHRTHFTGYMLQERIAASLK